MFLVDLGIFKGSGSSRSRASRSSWIPAFFELFKYRSV